MLVELDTTYYTKNLKLTIVSLQKEDVETALRTREMNRDEAMELLSSLRPSPVDQWRRHETGHSGFDPNSQSSGGQPFPRFNHASQQMSFPPVSNPNKVNRVRMVL